MEIWLLRHAAAEETASSGRDEDRALTAEGRERAEGVARGLAALGPGIGAIVSSPYRRARQTAEAAAAALGVSSPVRESAALEPGRDPEEIIAELEREAASAVLLVGHQPHLGALIGRLLAGGGGIDVPLRKAAAARISVRGRWSGELRALLPAPVLERLGR